MKKDWKFIESKEDYADNILRLYHKKYHFKPINRSMDFTLIEVSNWVTIIPITPDGKYILVKQFRVGADNDTLEFPGGAINRGEDITVAGKRELQEETGIVTDDISKLGTIMPNSALMSNHCTIFLAKNCVVTAKQNLDDFEDVEIVTLSEDELFTMIRDGRFDHAISLASLSFLLLSRGR